MLQEPASSTGAPLPAACLFWLQAAESPTLYRAALARPLPDAPVLTLCRPATAAALAAVSCLLLLVADGAAACS